MCSPLHSSPVHKKWEEEEKRWSKSGTILEQHLQECLGFFGFSVLVFMVGVVSFFESGLLFVALAIL